MEEHIRREDMKIGFFLSGKKGCQVLEDFLSKFPADFVSFVVFARDKNIANDYSNEIEEVCINNKLNFSDKNSFSLDKHSDYDCLFAIGWRWVIDECNKLIVLHDSLLPKYRGFSPLVNMLINGESEIGVTALKACSEYDAGSIILQQSIHISYPIKIKKAVELISPLYSDIVINLCEKIKNNEDFPEVNQEKLCATYSLWRDEDDYNIDWSLPADQIKRFCDAVGFPYSGASTYVNTSKVRVYDVEIVDDVVVEDRQNNIGKIIFKVEKFPIVVCGKGLLKIKEAKYDSDGKDIFDELAFRVRFLSQPKK